MTITQAVEALQSRLSAAATDADRDPAEIRIVAASKTRTPAEVIEAHEAGIRIFGENRVQEWREKAAACPSGIEWHFIGHLQRNKVNAVVGQVALIHSVDSIRLGEAIGARASGLGIEQPILLEVNVSGEITKHGLTPEEVRRAVERLAGAPGLRIDGLMTVGHPTQPEPGFRLLRELLAEVSELAPEARELSMGMSGDLEQAIAAGATLVRPGTALFGARPRMP